MLFLLVPLISSRFLEFPLDSRRSFERILLTGLAGIENRSGSHWKVSKGSDRLPPASVPPLSEAQWAAVSPLMLLDYHIQTYSAEGTFFRSALCALALQPRGERQQ